MIFLRPELLTALFFLAIPIIIHLFEFRIFKQTFFTNVLFLEHLKQEQQRHKKLKKWLILLSRLGFFSGLILKYFVVRGIIFGLKVSILVGWCFSGAW